MSYTDNAREARRMRAKAGAYTRRARKSAQDAEQYYQIAAKSLCEARSLTQSGRPFRFQDYGLTPTIYEDRARMYTSLGDLLLRSSFRATGHAETYKGLGASYAERAKRETA